MFKVGQKVVIVSDLIANSRISLHSSVFKHAGRVVTISDVWKMYGLIEDRNKLIVCYKIKEFEGIPEIRHTVLDGRVLRNIKNLKEFKTVSIDSL